MSRVDIRLIQAGGSTGLQNLHPGGGSSAVGLHSFDVGYTDRDHFVRNLTVLSRVQSTGELGGYEMILNGRGGGQPAEATLRMADFSTWNLRMERTIANNCRGINFPIPIRRFSEDEIFVLSGFSFDYGQGNDHQIQRIGVRPKPYRGVIEVSYGHSSATGPYRTALSWIALPWRHFGRTSPGDPQYRHPLKTFRDEDFTGSSSGSREHPNRLGLLHGFTFNFENGVQNFQKLKVDLGGESVDVTYRGNEPGQPAAALVEYVNWTLPIN